MQQPDQSPKLMVMFRSFAMLACLPLLITAQTPPPRFENYSVREIFHGVPTAPNLSTPWARLYRTRIRNAALNNEGFFRGFEYIQASGPNFAGHYRVANWGCGSGCLIMVIIDLETGQVHRPPLSAGKAGEDQIIIPNLGTGWGDFDFRLNSRLFVMSTCPWGWPDPKSPLHRDLKLFCGTSYFTMESKGFQIVRQVREELLPEPQ
jgi:hypothetical protein